MKDEKTKEQLLNELEEKRQKIAELEKAVSESRMMGEKYIALMENAADAIFLADDKANILEVNKKAEKLLGYTREELMNMKISQIHPEEEVERTMTVFTEHIKKVSGTLRDGLVLRKDGKTIQVDISGAKIEFAGMSLMQGIFRDITERKEAEEALQKAKDELEINVKERTSELEKTVKLLQSEITERKQAEKDLLSLQSRLEAVQQIGALASSTLDLDKVLHGILKGTLEALGASVGMIFLKDKGTTGTLKWGASIGLSEAFVSEYESKHIQPGEGLTGRIAQTGKPIYIPQDSSHDPRIARPVIVAEDLNSFIGVPIYAAGEIVGVMNVLTRPPDVLSEDNIPLITEIGMYVGSAIRNAQLFEERKLAEKLLTEYHRRLLTVLDGIDAIVYVADIKTYEILYVNEYTKNIFGDAEGKICWQYLQDKQTGPCNFCTNDKLLTSGGKPAGVYHWEFQNTITSKWYDIRDRAIKWVDSRIVRIEIATDITERKRIGQELLNSESKLRKQKNELENMNIALREIIKQVDIEKEKLRHDVEVNIKNTLLPILSKIKTSDRSEKYYDLLKFHLKELVSSFGRKIVKEDYNLTAREIEICNMIKGGLRSKEICGLLNISFETVEKHRKNIRRKVGISNKKVNLFYFLQKI